jgi:thiol-disulfide isomerase/thioredoxin
MTAQGRVTLGLIALLVVLVGLGWISRERFLPIEVGSRAPEFVATDLEGRDVSLADLRGSVVLLNVWATWCPPCRAEMPSMQRLQDHFRDEDFRVVAVSIDAQRGRQDRGGRPGGDVRAFTDSLRLDFDVWLDPAGSIERVYRTTGVPESFLIDRDGRIVKKVIGATEWDSAAHLELVQRLLER